MLVLVMGHRTLDFESDGGRVKGTQLFVSYAEDGVVGQMTESCFSKKALSCLS